MIERLRAHSATFGSRALILSPSRELAIQTLKVVKELSKGTDLKCVLLVGGDSLEEQFGFMSGNPDIVIATPGRFLHLKVEMSLNISSIKYVVFDEADRLFEMGFATQLQEILHSLPRSRQTLLFSATLPTSLVEFARAGLQEPSLVRLDADTKVSPDLESAFFSIKGEDKEGSLLHILHDVIKMPTGPPEGAENADGEKMSKKRKRIMENSAGKPSKHSTIIFTATKHHVEYIANLLQAAGFSVSHAYGTLDQTARRIQVENFRFGRTNILVVTDVAARGIDIPVLANVINYDFPSQPKVFVHRVGRTARAGQRGWSYSLVRDIDAPYLIDLQLFLGKPLVIGQEKESPSFSNDVVVGSLRRDAVDVHVEWFNQKIRSDVDIEALRGVSIKAEKLYMKTRNSAASQSAKRAREVVATRAWVQMHPVFGKAADDGEAARLEMMAKISNFKPQETIFEVSRTDKTRAEADVMREIRKKIQPRRRQEEEEKEQNDDEDEEMGDDFVATTEEAAVEDFDDDFNADAQSDEDSDDGLEVTVTNTGGKPSKGQDDWKDSEVFMSYTPRTINAAEERGYGVHSGGAFVEAARDSAMDLNNDDSAKAFGEASRQRLRWDKKGKKYVARANDEDGSKGAKMVVGESGVKIAASFQSGRFDKWRRDNRVGRMPRVGENEKSNSASMLPKGGARYKHKQERAPKEADKFRDDFHVQKKRVDEAREKRVGRFKDGMGSKKEVKGMDDIRKARREQAKKKAKNARPSRKRN